MAADPSSPAVSEPVYEYRVDVSIDGAEAYVCPKRKNVAPGTVGCSIVWMEGAPASSPVREPCWLWRVLFRATFEKRLRRAKQRCQRWCDRQNRAAANIRAKMAAIEI